MIVWWRRFGRRGLNAAQSKQRATPDESLGKAEVKQD